MNCVMMLVGRLVENEVKENTFTIAVNRAFKNAEGIYETDFIPCLIEGKDMCNNFKEYCRKGDIIGVKGRLETREDKLIVVVDKLTFLSSAKKEEE